MTDLSKYNPNEASNPEYNVFGLPTNEEDARLIIVPVPWEVTVTYGSGTARAPEAICKASLHVDLYDPDAPEAWQQGYYMRPHDRKILLKSDYLRKEAELYMDYTARGEEVEANQFMTKTLVEVNEGSRYLNNWVYEQTLALLKKDKLVGVLGGDHSVALGFFKSIAETQGDFGILQIDAHCDLREAYTGFIYSHASIMYNALMEIQQLRHLVQVGVRDYSPAEWNYVLGNADRVTTFFDKDIKRRQYEGETWKSITDEIVAKLPEKVFVSFDIDGLDRKLCPHTGTPVPGGFETEEVFYIFKKVIDSGRKIVGFDLSEVGISDSDWNSNVGARVLFKLCNLLVLSNS